MLHGETSAVARAWTSRGITEVLFAPDEYLCVVNAEPIVRDNFENSETSETIAIGDRHIIIVNPVLVVLSIGICWTTSKIM